ncbi:MAG: DUF1501 domain-containing protein [Vicinamibacterales bacterium]
MSHQHGTPRRSFLRLSAKLAALGVTSLGVGFGRPRGLFAAEAATAPGVTDYKALVCVYLFGGNDGNNTLVPVDGRYPTYQALRGNLALGPGKLLQPLSDGKGGSYAMHYGLTELEPLYNAGQLAFVLNMGQLDQPLTRGEYLQGQHTPSNLFSHSDQTVQAQTGTSTPNGSGWGGRLLDCCGVADPLAAVSVSAPALFLQGVTVGANVIPPGTGLNLSGMNFWPQAEAQSRRQAVNALLAIDGGNQVRKAANKALADGLQLSATLSADAGSDDDLTLPGTAIGRQLKEVARLIRLRSSMGPGRQVFFCSMDGFDLHSGQDWAQWDLFLTLAPALAAFHQAIGDAGLSDQVTAFTQSEFGRTLQPSGSGSDHAWGSHQMILGGAVKGGIYGAYPTLQLGGQDDANNRGVWIPTISTAQFGATLGRWFGASDADLQWAFPTLANFASSDVGFMKP